MKKWLKENKWKIVMGGLVLTQLLVIGMAFTTKANPRIRYDGDTIDNYDDREFYYLTHNSDGSLNEYGESLL